jgi:hypothetical protein
MAAAPWRPTRPLRCQVDTWRVPDEQAHVEAADVDAHLERRGGDHAQQLAGEEPRLDLTPLLGQEARAVGAHPGREARVGLDDPGVHQLGDHAGLGEGDGAQAHADGEPEELRGQGVGRFLGLEQQHLPPRSRGAVGLDDLELPPGEHRRQLAGIRDRRRRGDELGPGAVKVRDPLEPPQHLGDVGAEDAAVGVELVDHHHGEVAEEALPGGVVGQDAGVQHVGRRDEHVRRIVPQLAPLRGGGVAVVDRDADPRARNAQRARVLLQAPALVLLERLQGKEVERAGLRVRQRAPEHREVVDQRLAARRRRGEDDVLLLLLTGVGADARFEELDGPRLVGVEMVDPAVREHRGEIPEPVGHSHRQRRWAGVECLVVAQRRYQRVLCADRSQERRNVGHGDLSCAPPFCAGGCAGGAVPAGEAPLDGDRPVW